MLSIVEIEEAYEKRLPLSEVHVLHVCTVEPLYCGHYRDSDYRGVLISEVVLYTKTTFRTKESVLIIEMSRVIEVQLYMYMYYCIHVHVQCTCIYMYIHVHVGTIIMNIAINYRGLTSANPLRTIDENGNINDSNNCKLINCMTYMYVHVLIMDLCLKYHCM